MRVALILALLLALPAPCRAQDLLEEAKEQFVQGVALFQDGNYEGALVSFEASYVANPNYKVLYNIGLCYQALYRYTEAEEKLKAYLVEGAGDIPTERIAEVNDLLLELKSVIGEIDIRSEVEGASVVLDGKDMGTTPLEATLRVNIGEHSIEVMKEGYEPFSTEVMTPGKSSVEVWVELVPLKEPEEVVEEPVKKKKRGKPAKVPRAVFFAFVGLTGAIGAGAAVTGGLTLKKNFDFYDTPRSEEETWKKLRDDGKKLALTTDILLGAAGGMAIVTILLAVFTNFGREKEGGGQASLAAVVGPEMVGLDLEVRF